LRTAVGKHLQMKHLDRRVAVAPMMDWTDDRSFTHSSMA
jgi:tRNA-dihydrouridine synthase